MKKFNIILILIIFCLIGCHKVENPVSNIQTNENIKETYKLNKTEKDVIFNAARLFIPLNFDENVGIGILDKEQSKDRCFVAYFNNKNYDIYRFIFKDNKWEKDKLIEHYENTKSYSKAFSKVLIYESSIAEIYKQKDYESLLENNWFINDKSQSGTYWYPQREYITDLPHSAKFIEGSEINNNKEWTVTFAGEWICKAKKPNNPEKWETWYLYAKEEPDLHQDYHNPESGEWEELWPQSLSVKYNLLVEDVSPTTPTLSSPSDNHETYSTQITFEWNSSSGADPITYQLQVDDNSDFSSPNTNQSNISNNYYSVSNLSKGTNYYWRVRASNNYGTSSWSSARIVKILPSIPVVSYSVYNGHPKLQWDSASGAQSYEIYRNVNSGSWGIWEKTTSTSYIDNITDVINLLSGQPPFSCDYVGYKVRSKSSVGTYSGFSFIGYFEADEIVPESIGF